MHHYCCPCVLLCPPRHSRHFIAKQISKMAIPNNVFILAETTVYSVLTSMTRVNSFSLICLLVLQKSLCLLFHFFCPLVLTLKQPETRGRTRTKQKVQNRLHTLFIFAGYIIPYHSHPGF